MIEMKNDMNRRARFEHASVQAHKEGVFDMQDTMADRLNALREKQTRPKKSRLPLILKIISGLSLIVFFFMPESEPLKRQMAQQIQQQQQQFHQNQIHHDQQMPMHNQSLDLNDPASIEKALNNAVNHVPGEEKATVTVTIGGKTFTRELSVQEIQAMQQMQNIAR